MIRTYPKALIRAWLLILKAFTYKGLTLIYMEGLAVYMEGLAVYIEVIAN